MFVKPAEYQGDFLPPSDCTPEPVAPILDSILVGTHVASAMYAKSEIQNPRAAIAFNLIGAGVWLSSAIYGFYFTTECRNLTELAARNRARRMRRTVLSGPPSASGGPEAEEPVPAPAAATPTPLVPAVPRSPEE